MFKKQCCWIHVIISVVVTTSVNRWLNSVDDSVYKGKGHPIKFLFLHGWDTEAEPHPFDNLGARSGGGLVSATPRPFTPGKRSGTSFTGSWMGIRTGKKNFALTGNRSPGLPVRSGSIKCVRDRNAK
jgi:hypothetical protein